MPESQITLLSQANKAEARDFFVKYTLPITLQQIGIALGCYFVVYVILVATHISNTTVHDIVFKWSPVNKAMLILIPFATINQVFGWSPFIRNFLIGKEFSTLNKTNFYFTENEVTIITDDIEIKLKYDDIEDISTSNNFVVIFIDNYFTKFYLRFGLSVIPIPIYSNSFVNINRHSFVKEIRKRCKL